MLGDIRQGALAAVVGDAVAKAAGVPVASVRRALMLRGDLGAVAAVALGGGDLGEFRLELGRPIAPMLASTAPRRGGGGGEDRVRRRSKWKLDGARIQVHRDGDDVGVYSRTLDDVTARVPEVVRAALALPARSFVLDGEAIALRADGRPFPFQVTGSRFATKSGGGIELTPMLLRPAAPRRRGPARPAGIGARGGAVGARAGRAARAAAGARRCSRRRWRRATRASW